MTRVAEINRLVQDALAAGVSIVEVHHDTYAQHLLREHANVCRQALAGEGRYLLHREPCECPPGAVRPPQPVSKTGVCCSLRQALTAECMLCGEPVG